VELMALGDLFPWMEFPSSTSKDFAFLKSKITFKSDLPTSPKLEKWVGLYFIQFVLFLSSLWNC
jgi:hypothetical protein